MIKMMVEYFIIFLRKDLIAMKNFIIENTTLIKYIDDGMTHISIPRGITAIGDCAFRDCTNLIAINIPNSVTTIGAGAFAGCYNLTFLSIPKTVTHIGNGAFSNCEAIEALILPNGICYTDDGTYERYDI